MKAVRCPECSGEGRILSIITFLTFYYPKCPRCKGRGWVEIPGNLTVENGVIK